MDLAVEGGTTKSETRLLELKAELLQDYGFIVRCQKELEVFQERWRLSPEDEPRLLLLTPFTICIVRLKRCS